MKNSFIAAVYEETLINKLNQLNSRDDLLSDAFENAELYGLKPAKALIIRSIDKIITQEDEESTDEMLDDLKKVGCYLTGRTYFDADNKFRVEVVVHTNKGTFSYIR